MRQLQIILLSCLLILVYPACGWQPEGQWVGGRAGYVNINGREYYMDDVTRRDWSQATDFCIALDMVLVSLETQIENDAIYQYFTDQGVSDLNFWTSGSKVVDNWMWIGTGAPITYFNWAVDEPNSVAASVCIHTSAAGWGDDDCYTLKNYLCEQR